MSRLTVAIGIDSEQLLDELLGAQQLERLRGIAEVVAPERGSGRLPDGAADAEVLLTGWGAPRLDAAVLDRLPRLRAVVHAAGTVKPIVSPALWARGVRVSSAADANAVPVAEYSLAMILLAAKGVAAAETAYRATGDLTASRPPARAGAFGARVGLVGASRIGRLVAERLRPFDLEVLLYDPSISALQAAVLGTAKVELDELLLSSDVVSLHAPALPETDHMVGARQLALMRDGATLLNTARGRLVDTEALVREVASGRLRAVLDVTDPEPLPLGHPLFSSPGVTLTPHVAGSLGNELRRIGRFAVDEIEGYAASGLLRGEVLELDLPRIA